MGRLGKYKKQYQIRGRGDNKLVIVQEKERVLENKGRESPGGLI